MPTRQLNNQYNGYYINLKLIIQCMKYNLAKASVKKSLLEPKRKSLVAKSKISSNIIVLASNAINTENMSS